MWTLFIVLFSIQHHELRFYSIEAPYPNQEQCETAAAMFQAADMKGWHVARYECFTANAA